MYILQVNFEYPGITPDKAAALNDPARATPFLSVQGLLWKIWLNTEGGPKVGGLYCFDSRASAEAYLQALNKLQAKVQRIGRLVG